MNESMVLVGAIAGSYGCNGEVRLKSFTSNPLSIEQYNPLYSKDLTETYYVRIMGQLKNSLRAKISTISSKEAAENLKGCELFVNRSCFPELAEDEFYYADLIGLQVLDSGGVLIGKVKAIFNHGASDLLEIEQSGVAKKILLPFTKANVPVIDISRKKIIADPPDGLFEVSL